MSQPWHYERIIISDCNVEQRLLARIVIAKVVAAVQDLEKVVEAVPVFQNDDVEASDGRVTSCRTWVRDAIQEMARQDVVLRLSNWEKIQEKALQYVERKKEIGRWDLSLEGKKKVPMMDLSSGQELIR
jgi:hypothetical protein